ncbi:type III pantothenate kinase [Rhodopirellula bahusiensis]|uniref:Type III pantothenate kinase n=2 Tax=Rhodopirellula bahusiensis TaxID=2014065 RepID=A0A2G1W3S5_9BACT|nr:type III pantothenate kinase [Rhodopirellula bahusiensis]PHQ33329.1 type III pantothenate kinase [Rhodopirellula bahusiensis]
MADEQSSANEQQLQDESSCDVVMVRVGIDVGNTAIKVVTQSSPTDGKAKASHDRGPLLRSISLRDPEWITKCVEHLRLLAEQLSGCESSDCESVCYDVRVASVNRGSAEPLVVALDEAFFNCIRVRFVTHEDVAMAIDVSFPERVGIDRLLGAEAAFRRHEAPLIVVDAGTTVTVDFVSAEGIFRGGAILPGLEMQTAALAAGTDALPKLDWASHRCREMPEGPGRDTVAAMRLGVLASVAGAVERLLRIYGGAATLVVTGGDAGCLVDALPAECDAVEEPHLVAQALLDLLPLE